VFFASPRRDLFRGDVPILAGVTINHETHEKHEKDSGGSDIMYQIIGNNKIIRNKDIIGIFDLDTATVSAVTRKFLADAEKAGGITDTAAAGTIPRKFVLTNDGIYLCTRTRELSTFNFQLST
jgi:hypothetical protein